MKNNNDVIGKLLLKIDNNGRNTEEVLNTLGMYSTMFLVHATQGNGCHMTKKSAQQFIKQFVNKVESCALKIYAVVSES